MAHVDNQDWWRRRFIVVHNLDLAGIDVDLVGLVGISNVDLEIFALRLWWRRRRRCGLFACCTELLQLSVDGPSSWRRAEEEGILAVVEHSHSDAGWAH